MVRNGNPTRVSKVEEQGGLSATTSCKQLHAPNCAISKAAERPEQSGEGDKSTEILGLQSLKHLLETEQNQFNTINK